MPPVSPILSPSSAGTSPAFVLELSGDAGIRRAQDVARQLGEAVAAHPAIVVATSGLTAADLTTVQSLLSARATATGQGKALALAQPLAGPLADVLSKMGFNAPGQPHAAFWSSL